MCEVTLQLPDELIESAEPEGLANLAREALLIRLYSLGKVSSSRCAEVLGTSRRAFLDLAGDYGVSLFDEPEDLNAEVCRGLQ